MRTVIIILVLFMISCSYSIGKEINYSGYSDTVAVGVISTDQYRKTCNNFGCVINTTTKVTVGNPTQYDITSKIKCDYKWGDYPHGSITTKPFTLGPNKKRVLYFYYNVDIPRNQRAEIVVECDNIQL